MGDAHVHCGTCRDVATLANLVLCMVGGEERRGGGGVNITTDHSCHITLFNHGS